MSVLKVGFSDFWPQFNPTDNYFTQLLSQAYDVEVCDTPDVLIFSVFGRDHARHKCRKIFYTGENVRPDLGICDFAFSFDWLDHPRHYRFPLYARKQLRKLVRSENESPEKMLANKNKFCNFVYSNPHCRRRNAFLDTLSKYRRVDSGGRFRNNIGGPVADKKKFIESYKFTIAFENESYPGYTTEKIFEPMLVGSMPIYWGNPLVHRDFNTASFLNYHEFDSEEALIEEIIRLDKDDSAYLERISNPWLHDNLFPEKYSEQNLLNEFRRAIDDEARPASQQLLYPLRYNVRRVRRNLERMVRDTKRLLRVA